MTNPFTDTVQTQPGDVDAGITNAALSHHLGASHCLAHHDANVGGAALNTALRVASIAAALV